MTWFKVDDKFHSHAKVARLGDDSDALALWVVAGSWSADQLTDGWVPAYVARKLDPDYARRAAALVRVGLWEEAEREDEKGWVFHGWNEPGRQPTAEQVKTEREQKSARQQRWREKHRAENGRFDVDGDVDGDVDASTGRLGDGDVDAARVDAAPDPTRPDPTNTDSLRSSVEPPASSRGSEAPPEGGERTQGVTASKGPERPKREPKRVTSAPDRLEITVGMYAWAANEHGLSRKVVDFETNQFLDHHRARGSTFKDWKSAWQTWMRRVNQYSPRSAQLSLESETPAAQARPAWCGLCNESTRMVEDEDRPYRCPNCHPTTQKAEVR